MKVTSKISREEIVMEQNLLEKKDQQDQWISNLFKGIGAVEKMNKLKTNGPEESENVTTFRERWHRDKNVHRNNSVRSQMETNKSRERFSSCLTARKERTLARQKQQSS